MNSIDQETIRQATALIGELAAHIAALPPESTTDLRNERESLLRRADEWAPASRPARPSRWQQIGPLVPAPYPPDDPEPEPVDRNDETGPPEVTLP